MHDAQAHLIQYWVDVIAKSELPAITSTAKMLDKFNNDDKSSLPKLSKAILHDQALASCLLKVANSVQHLSVNKVSTVSRASVVLGIQAVKNICLTSRLVEGLLANKDLDVHVHQQLTQSMANSFHAGLLAKMMAPQYAEDTQEELYLAAMLYRIGETAFWGVGGDSAKSLATFVDTTPAIFQKKCHKELGGDFTQLSGELAKTWSLSDLLLKALDQPQSRTIEVQIIYFADKLSNCIANPTGSVEEFQQLLSDIAKITGLNIRQLTAKIEIIREQASKLLTSYGAKALIEHIKPLPKAKDFNDITHKVLKYNPNKESEVLTACMQMNKLLRTTTDFSTYIQATLQATAGIFAFEQCTFFMMVDDKSAMKARFSFDINSQPIEYNRKFNLIKSMNIFSHVMNTDQAVLINDKQAKQWYQYITGEIADYIGSGAVLIMPVKVGHKAIGVITAQVFIADKVVSLSDFDHCSALIEHLNLSLTMLSHKS